MWCGETITPEDCDIKLYEVALCDPLHDLKNLISRIFEELPYQVDNPELKKDISDFCRESWGKQTTFLHSLCQFCNDGTHQLKGYRVSEWHTYAEQNANKYIIHSRKNGSPDVCANLDNIRHIFIKSGHAS